MTSAAEQEARCPACGGSGETLYGSNLVRCDDCHGSGVLATSPSPVPAGGGGEVVGEEADAAILAAVQSALGPGSGYPRLKKKLFPVVAALVAQARTDGAAEERKAILRDLAEFESETKAVRIKDDMDNARIVGIQDASLVVRQRSAS